MEPINSRTISGWGRFVIANRPQTILQTTSEIDEEIFASLEYVSEIPSVGIEFITKRGGRHASKTFYKFQSFIRQGRTFYRAGKQLHFRASSLMYYYSFLNLVKAYISLSDPNYVTGRVSHGLTHIEPASRPLSKQAVKVTSRKGVFQKFFEIETEEIIQNNFRLNIAAMLGYCTDVQHEYSLAEFGTSKIIPVMNRLGFHRGGRIAWPYIAVNRFDILQPYKKTLESFWKYFQQVSPDKENARAIFGTLAESYSQYTYFESKRTYKYEDDDSIDLIPIKNDLFYALKSLYEAPLYADEYDFKLTIPLRINHQIPFNQPLAIYTVMFFMGSLVRYFPHYLEALIDSKDAWIVERFVRNSAITFLRYISNAILAHDYIYINR